MSASFTESLAMLYEDDRARQRIAGHYWHRSGPHLAAARTEIVRWFLALEHVPWLLQIDSDQAFEPTHFLDLLALADPYHAPIVGGLIAGAIPWWDGTADVSLEAGWLRPDGTMAMLTKLPPLDPPLLRVDFITPGFTLVHRRVFMAMLTARPDHPLPWFEEATCGRGIHGEDYAFCRRADDLGYPSHLATGVRIGHVKTVTIWPTHVAPKVRTAR